MAKTSRGKLTEEKLLDALERLLRKRPFHAIGVAEIAREADVAVGTVYRRFESKLGLMSALQDLYWTRAAEWGDAHAASITTAMDTDTVGLEHFIKARIDLACRSMHDLAHIARPVYLVTRQHPELVKEAAGKSVLYATEKLARDLGQFEKELALEPDEAAPLVMYVLQSCLADFVLFKDATVFPSVQMSLDGFVCTMTTFLVSRLVTDCNDGKRGRAK